MPRRASLHVQLYTRHPCAAPLQERVYLRVGEAGGKAVVETFLASTVWFEPSAIVPISTPAMASPGTVKSAKSVIADKGKIESMVDRQIRREMAADRREARASARMRVRARELKEAAEAAVALLDESATTVLKTSKMGAAPEDAVIRPLSPLELGLMYVWMEQDEATAVTRLAAEKGADRGANSSSDEDDAETVVKGRASGFTRPSAMAVPPQLMVSRWWSGGAVGLQQTWEACMGWVDEKTEAAEAEAAEEVVRELESRTGCRSAVPSDPVDAAGCRHPRSAESSVAALQEAVAHVRKKGGGRERLARMLGATAARAAAAEGSAAAQYLDWSEAKTPRMTEPKGRGLGAGPFFLGAFTNCPCVPFDASLATGSATLERHAPRAFLATRYAPPEVRSDGRARRPKPLAAGTEWAIDAMGTRLTARGSGLGRSLALCCMSHAKQAAISAAKAIAEGVDGASFAYRIDSLPSAVGFWKKLGFTEEQAKGEQLYWRDRGGDLPLVKWL